MSQDNAHLYAKGKPAPTFVIKATDALAYPTVRAYADICRQMGLRRQAAEVEKALEEIREWQAANVEQTKLPDHEHVPAWTVEIYPRREATR